jgi:hypothetical protein
MNRTKRKQIKLMLKRITNEQVIKVNPRRMKKEIERKRLNDLIEAEVFARFFRNLIKKL